MTCSFRHRARGKHRPAAVRFEQRAVAFLATLGRSGLPWLCTVPAAAAPQQEFVWRSIGHRTLRCLIGGLLLQVAAAAASDRPCGIGSPCAVSGGDYYLAFPTHWRAHAGDELPALLFFHGFRSSGENVIKSGSLRSEFGGRGYLIIAPNGVLRPARQVRGWAARPDATALRDDLAFVDEVIDDVAARVPLNRDRLLVSGFSSGGSMAWLMACYRGDGFAGFVPVAGGLRRPIPSERCPRPARRLLHIHGFTDRQVPLEGRQIRDWHQGDVFASLALLRRSHQCRSRPSRFAVGERFRCRVWDECEHPASLEICLHDGGHGLPQGWTRKALDWFETK